MTEDEVFLAALDLPTAAARAAYLDETCRGDTDFRRQVEALLAAHFRSGEFLDVPAAKQVSAASRHDNTFTTNGDGVYTEKNPEALDGLHFLTPSSRPDSLGRLGHYEVLQVLGQGGFGIVFRALDETLQRVVAVKVLAPQLATTSPARKRFLREARSSARVRHENVVQVYAVEEQPLPYLVMEFIPGETLQQRLDRVGPLETLEAVQIGRQIAEGLAAAHSMGLIHRDIKPANILIEASPPERVKITDFGLARAADDASLTQSGFIAGTPMYMAPEQARGDTLDHRTDLFSLGSVLYAICSGRPPFRANSTLAVLKRVAEDTPRPIPEIIPEVPPSLCEIITRLHAKTPADRFASAREVANLLTHYLAHLQNPGQVVAPPVAGPAKMEKVPPSRSVPEATPMPRRPRWCAGRWAIAGTVLLTLLGGLGFAEAIGVTDFRGRVVSLLSPEAPPDAKVANASDREPHPKTVPDEKTAPAPDTKQPVAVTPPAPSSHEVWLKAVAILPLDNQGAALVGMMKEHRPGFEEAFLKAIPGMPADRQAILVDMWLREPKPAFAGFEEAWLKAFPAMPPATQALLVQAWLKEHKLAFARFEDAWLKAVPAMTADTQAVVLAAWLKERNPTFDGSLTHKAEGGVITSLEVPAPIVQDLSPLRALTGLKSLVCRNTLGCDNKAESDTAMLRSLKALEQINGKPVAQFWKDVEARQGEFKEWLQLVPALTAQQQVTAVAARIKLRNPAFDGQVNHKIEDGVVTEIGVSGGNLTDLSPVRALVGLKSLVCNQGEGGRVLSDLSPLKDLKLTSLGLHFMPVSDLSPLKEMKLTSLSLILTEVTDLSLLKDNTTLTTLDLYITPVSDLSPLKNLTTLRTLNLSMTNVVDLSPLKHTQPTSLNLERTGVTDLSPLKDLKLTTLRLNEGPVADLQPLKDMKLTELECWSTNVSDLSPLKGMPLTRLLCQGTQVFDLSPLKGMQLEEIRLTPKNITQGRDILRDMKSLKTIGVGHSDAQVWPAAEFWDRYDRGEFN